MGHITKAALRPAACTALAAAALTACGSAAPAAAPSRTVTVTASAAATAPAASGTPASTPAPSVSAVAGTPVCLASALRASLGASEGAAGTTFQTVVLTSTGTATCALQGFPGVSFVTSPGGSQIGAAATRSPVSPAVAVRLAPGASVTVMVGVAVAANFPAAKCQPTSASWLRIYPPGDFSPVYLSYHAQACADSASSVLSVTAVRAG